MFDFGESRCVALDLEKCDERFPPYVDFEDTFMLSASDTFLSGVNGEDLFRGSVVVCARGDGVNGIRPPAVRVENMPVWDLIGVDTAVAIFTVSGYDLGRKTIKCIDR